MYIKFRYHCLSSAKMSQSAKCNSVRNSLHVCLIHLVRNPSAMDSDSDFGFGGIGDDDTSFTPSVEEEEQQQDENIVRNPSAIDSDSDFGFGGNGDDDASFTPSVEEEEQQQDENIVPATVTPTTGKKETAQIQFTRKALPSAECVTTH